LNPINSLAILIHFKNKFLLYTEKEVLDVGKCKLDKQAISQDKSIEPLHK